MIKQFNKIVYHHQKIIFIRLETEDGIFGTFYWPYVEFLNPIFLPNFEPAELIDLGPDFSKDIIDDEMLDKELQSYNISQLTGTEDGCISDLQPHGQGRNEHEDGMCDLGVEDGDHSPLVHFSRMRGKIFWNVLQP